MTLKVISIIMVCLNILVVVSSLLDYVESLTKSTENASLFNIWFYSVNALLIIVGNLIN